MVLYNKTNSCKDISFCNALLNIGCSLFYIYSFLFLLQITLMATDKKLSGIRFPEDVLEKIKYIAWLDRRTITTVVIIACEAQIKEFEKKHGVITEEQIKKIKAKK